MPVAMPLIKISDDLRINLFNVTRIKREVGENIVSVLIYYHDGNYDALTGEEAQTFLAYFDDMCDPMTTPRREAPAEPPPTTDGAVTDRDFGALVEPGGPGPAEPPGG